MIKEPTGNPQAADHSAQKIAREQLELLAEASLILGASLDYAATLDNLGRFLVPRLADNMVVDLIDRKGNFRRVSFTAERPDREAALRELAENFPPDPQSGAARQVVNSRQPICIPTLDDAFFERVAQNEHHLRLMKATGGRSLIVVPLIVRDEVIGAINFGMADSGRMYSESDLPLMQEIARRAALAVDHARLYRAARKELRRRKRAQRRTRAITDSLPLLISYVDRDGYYRFNSKSYEHWLGREMADITGRHVLDVLGEAAYERVKPYITEVLAGNATGYIGKMPHQDGSLRTVDVRYIPDALPDGTVRGFYAMVSDITDLLTAKDQAQLYLDVAANIPAGLVIWRLEELSDPGSLRLVAANPAAVKLAVTDLTQIGKTINEAYPFVQTTGRAETYANVIRKQQVVDFGEVHFPPTEQTEERFYAAKAFPLPNQTLGIVFDDVTERKRIEEQARLYGDVAKHASIGLTIWELEDLNAPDSLRLIAANPAMSAIYGGDINAHLGSHIYDAFPEMRAENRADFYSDVVRSGEAVEVNQYPNPLSEDSTRVYTIRAFPLPGQRVGVAMHDVTDLRLAQQQLSKALERTRALYGISRQITLATSPQAILQVLVSNADLKDAERAAILIFDTPWGATVPANAEVIAHWARYVGATSVTGAKLSMVDHGTAHVFDPTTPTVVPNIDDDPRVSQSTRAAMKAVGTSSFILFPLTSGGITYGMVSLQSVKPFELTEQELTHLKGLIDQAASAIYTLRLLEQETAGRQAAEQSVHDRMRFLAMVSHELRTPLTSIKGFASSLLATDVEWDIDSQHAFLQVINDEADRMAELVEQVLDLSRLEAGTLSIELRPVSVKQMISGIMPQLMTLCENHRLNITAKDVLPPVLADARRIGQVITNLTNNACKYSPAGSLVVISAAQDAQMICISVADAGVGIPQEERDHVFETFRQATNRPATETRGVGLGLTIAKALIEAHGGSIWIESGDTPGTTITFTLPIST